MIKIKIIKTEKEYTEALARIDALMDAAPGSAQEEELELLALLAEKYEEEHFPIDPPDPVEAILFRMEQEGITARDMIKYLGSQSKVSEVLNNKRSLSLTMIRNLHQGLGIPAEVLLQQPARQDAITYPSGPNKIDQDTLYFNASHLAKEFKQSDAWEWVSKATGKASKQKLPPFDRESVDESLFAELVRLGSYSAGPQMARELLNKKGIHMIVQKIAFNAEFDGACFFTPQRRPVISLTLQNNRLEDFWFTLFHLLAHLYLQRGEKPVAFFDSIENVFDKTAPSEERRVNALLKDALAPSSAWKTTIQTYLITGDEHSLNKVIQTLDISPEIFSCWLRLEKEDIKKYAVHFNPKKVSEKLEVYG